MLTWHKIRLSLKNTHALKKCLFLDNIDGICYRYFSKWTVSERIIKLVWGILRSASGPNFSSPWVTHFGFTPWLLYSSTPHSPEEGFIHLNTGWALDAWLQWLYDRMIENWYSVFDRESLELTLARLVCFLHGFKRVQLLFFIFVRRRRSAAVSWMKENIGKYKLNVNAMLRSFSIDQTCCQSVRNYWKGFLKSDEILSAEDLILSVGFFGRCKMCCPYVRLFACMCVTATTVSKLGQSLHFHRQADRRTCNWERQTDTHI